LRTVLFLGFLLCVRASIRRNFRKCRKLSRFLLRQTLRKIPRCLCILSCHKIPFYFFPSSICKTKAKASDTSKSKAPAVCCSLSCSSQATNKATNKNTMLKTVFVIFSLSSGPFGLCDYLSRFSAFFVFFSVFSCFSACRNKSVILPFLGFSRVCPVSPLYCVPSGLPCYPSARLAVAVSYRGALSLFQGLRFVALDPARLRLAIGCAVSVSVGVGCRVPVGPSRPVWLSYKCTNGPLEQVFGTGVREKNRHFFGAFLSKFPTES